MAGWFSKKENIAPANTDPSIELLAEAGFNTFNPFFNNVEDLEDFEEIVVEPPTIKKEKVDGESSSTTDLSSR